MTSVPVVLGVDVEPDGRTMALPRTEEEAADCWRGFSVVNDWIEPVRERLAAATGAPVRFSWFFRLDPQIVALHGEATWPLRHFAREVAALAGRGDELGVHVHAWRREGDSWVTETGDPEWVASCVDDALAAFERARGAPCRSFRFGDHWLDDRTVRLLEARGVRVDLTLEPGMVGDPVMAPGERRRGAALDFARVPREPYRPSTADFRVPDATRTDGLWMMPVGTGRIPRALAGAYALYHWIRGTARGGQDRFFLNPALPAVVFRAALEDHLRNAPPVLVLMTRTDAGTKTRALRRIEANLAHVTRALAGGAVFCTPEEALARVTSARPPSRDPVPGGSARP